ncbi:kinase-like protein, partial [Ophiobolus disseminans]
PCPACSWTTWDRLHCCYTSHIKLIYTASDRGVWSLGPKYIFKERPASPPTFEPQNLRFIAENTTMPIPTLITDYEDDGRTYIQMTRGPGETLEEAWPRLTSEENEGVARDTAAYLAQLRGLKGGKMAGLGEKPVYNTFLFHDDFGVPHGPISSSADLWAHLALQLKDIPAPARERMRQRMPAAESYTFTHGDLAIVNIMGKDGKLAGIIDWERSAYLPVWWEYVGAGIGLSDEDAEWKALLRKYLGRHEGAREWGVDMWLLRKYSELDERGEKALAKMIKSAEEEEVKGE